MVQPEMREQINLPNDVAIDHGRNLQVRAGWPCIIGFSKNICKGVRFIDRIYQNYLNTYVIISIIYE